MKSKRLLTLLIGICLVLVVVAVPFMAACAKPAPTPAPTPAPAPTPVEPIKLKFSHPQPPVTVFHKDILTPWTEKIKERTTAIGKPVEITIYPAQSLGKATENYSLVAKGVVDIALFLPGSTPGRFPLSGVMDLPFLFPSSTVASQAGQELFQTRAEFQKEFAENKLLWFQFAAPKQVLVRTKEIKTLEDFKGLKVWADSETVAEIVKALEAVPVFMAVPEVYIALERGLLDVVFFQWEGSFAFKFFEVTKYRTALPQGIHIPPLPVSMNWDTFNGLPPDVQKIFEETIGLNMSKSAGETVDRVEIQLLGLIEEYDKKVGNPEIYNLPEDEFQRWKEATSPVNDMWIADMEAKGLPGKAVLEDVQRLVEKYSK